MRIFLLKSYVPNEPVLYSGISLAKEWCKTIGLTLDFIIQNTLTEFHSVPVSTSVVTNGYVVNSQEIFNDAKRLGFKFDIDSVVCLVYDWTKIRPQPTNPSENGMNISIPAQWFVSFPEVFADFLLHELAHYYFSATGKQDITERYDPRFSQLPRKDWYLFLLKDLTQKNMPTYKYFNPKSDPLMAGLKDELMQKLDQARGFAGIPFKITSGVRTALQNAQAGGTGNSSHLTGEACDVASSTPQGRLKMVSALLKAGFTRIGIYTEHLHIDISKTLSQNVMWVIEKD